MSSRRIILTKEFAYPVTAAVSTFYLLFWQAMKVSYVRHQAKITYPQLYAERAEAEASLAARVFNCMQRAHQNTLEQIPVILSGTLIGGMTYPIAAAALCGTWVFTRVLYTIGYSTGDPEKFKFAFTFTHQTPGLKLKMKLHLPILSSITLESLHALSGAAYTTLQHPNVSTHSVRIKESTFCDGQVRAYTGYIDAETRHHFFYFFESRTDPANDDVVFWTNGGPGGSSALGAFMELGPCRVTSANSTERFEYAWNERANVFFIDQPVDVGFSYADPGVTVSSTVQAGQDIAAFLTIFFEYFSQLKGRPFHLAGESYGGRYLPVYAAAILDQNVQLVESGMTPINLSSVMITNGCTDFLGMLTSYYEIQCEDHGFPSFTSVADCVSMKQMVPPCQKKIQKSCKDVLDNVGCAEAWNFCWGSFTALFSRINTHDALRPCIGKPDLESCYPITKDIEDYLNDPTIQAALGVDPSHSNFTLNSVAVQQRFFHDFWDFRAEHYLALLLERGLRVLIAVGTTDWVCNWVGNERMTLELEWTSQEAFRKEPLREWFVDGQVAGKTRTAGNLTYATILDAGHFVPYDQPVRAFELANRWLAGEDL
ncbi:Alpha/Beta hydrolase protein [Daedaleopsis nitida]|nr:Alpha/Beta hydrolase protein [Daedaleopsis nitida]